MRTIKYILILFQTFLICRHDEIYSQSITNLSLNFPNPTSTDNLKVIAKEMFSTGQAFNSSSVSISNNLIYVVSKRTLGLTFGLTFPTDTVLLGQLAPGSYTLFFDLKDNVSLVSFDVDTLFFTVGIPADVSSIAKTGSLLIAFPNPSSSSFYLKHSFDLMAEINITVYNIYGQKIKSYSNLDYLQPIDFSDQVDGTYIIEVTSNDKKSWTRIIKNTP